MFYMKKDFWKRVLSGLTAVSLLVNSLLPYSVASIIYAQESNNAPTQDTVLSSATPLESPSVSPTPDSTPAVPEYSTPTPDPEITLTPTPEVTPTPTPEIVPSNLSPPTPTPTLEPSPTPSNTPDLNTNLENTQTLSDRPQPDFVKDSQSQKLNYVPGEVIVKYKQSRLNLQGGLGFAQSLAFENTHSLIKKDEIKNLNIQVFSSKKSTENLIKELKLDPAVEYAEPNYLRFPTTISTNDTYKDLLWGLDNTGQTVNGTAGANDADIDAPEAWNISSGSGNIIVAIIDSGVAYNHPDLIANMWDGTNCKDENGVVLGGCNHGYDFENNDKTPLPDSSSHGTHVAGIIAAAKNNAKGVIGVSPNAKIMALKYGFNVASEVKAIDFAIQNGAKVINASFGGAPYSQSEYDAINRFRTAGGIFVAAAGNGGSDGIGDNNENTHFYPSDYNLDNIISVAATDQNDSLATFSDYGVTSVDVAAPGTNIYSTVANSTISEETFDSVIPPAIPSGWTKGGTSNNWGTYSLGGSVGNVLYGDLAYPYANNRDTNVSSPTYNLSTGGATMSFWASCDTEYKNDGWYDYMELEYSADGNTFVPATDPFFGGDFKWDEPYLDNLNGDSNQSGNAVYYFENIPIQSQYLTSSFKFRFRWVSNSSDNNYDGCFVDDVNITKLSDGSDEKYDYMQGTSMATPYVAGLAALIWGYKPNLTSAQVKDRILQTGDSKPSLAGKTVSGKRINAYNALNGLNHAPTTSAVPTTLNEDTPATITLSGSDVDGGDTLVYSIVSGPTHGTLETITGNQVSYTPALNYNGSDSFTYKANDGFTDSNTSTVSITINPVNDAPVANAGSATTLEDTLTTIVLSASDVDADPLTYSIVSGVSHGTLGTITGNQVSYTPSANYNGSDSFTFKANDGTVDSNTATVNITVTPVNDAPVLDPIGNKTVNELETLTFTAIATDPDSSSLTYSLTNAPIGATINPTTGVFGFTPTETQGPGHYTFIVNVSDGYATDFEEITVTVNEVNVAPVAQDVSTSTNEDTVKTITLSAADSDLPANTLTYSIVSGVSHGILGTIAGNQVSYTPSANYNGSDSFTYKTNDGTVDSNTATVTITVIAVNDAPVVSNGSVTTNEDTPIIISLSGTDVDGDPLTYSIVSSVSHGTLGIISGNHVTYTPALNYNGSDSFTFKANDGTVNSNTATVSITIAPVDDAPIAVADSYTTNEDTALNVVAPGVLANDSDVDSPSLSSVLVSGVAHGNLTLNTNGSFSYIPASNYNGLDSFDYKVNDGTLDSNTTTVSISVIAVNDAPTAVPDTVSIDEDTTLVIAKTTLLANDSDIDGDSITLTGVSNPTYGTVSVSTDNVTFTPTLNYFGPASFDYTISDGHLSSTTTVTVTVNPVNDAPVLDPIGNKNVDEFSTLTINVNATDVDNANLIYTTSALPLNSTFNPGTKTFTFTPDESQGGQNYQVTFTVSDGALTDEETITISVNEVNSAPVAVNDSASVNEDNVLTINTNTLLANDYDLDTNTNAGLTITAVNTGVNGVVSLSGTTITFTPNANFNGTASFKYIVSDGSLTDTGTVTVTVNPVNDAPVLNPIGNKNVNEFSTLTINVNATDVDSTNLTYSASDLPQNATFNPDTKTFTFTPDESQGGTIYHVTFTVSDGTLTDEETISITVNEVNNAPIAQNDQFVTNEDSAITISTTDLLANDSDPDNAHNELTITAVSNPVHGTVLISSNNVIFTPDLNYFGPASFDYTVSDGYLTDTATVNITINPVNDAPVANNGLVTTDEDTLVTINLSANDVENDSLAYSIVSGVSHGTLSNLTNNHVDYTPSANYNGSDSFTFKANDGAADSNTATVTITINPVNDPPVLEPIGNKNVDELTTLEFTVTATDPDSVLTYSLINAPSGVTINPNTGVFSFTPTESQGPGSYTLTISVTDGSSIDSEEIIITVNEVNIAPVASDNSVSINEDVAKTITLSATDPDIPANTLTYSIASGVGHGVLSNLTYNQVTYTPNADYNGPDSFTFKANDGTTDSNIATVTITVNPVNDAPVANPDNAVVNEDTSLTIAKSDLLANDTDIDGDFLNLISVSAPVHGSVVIDGNNIVFTPTANYNGPASFNYTISDGILTSTTTVSITVNPVNDAPVAEPVSVTTSEDTPVTINLSASDVDGDTLTYAIGTGVGHGVLGLIIGNQLLYTPSVNYNGLDTFTYKANDGSVDSNIATVSITVTPVNDPPVLASIGNKTVDELTNLTFIVTATDPDSTVTYSLTGAPIGAVIGSSDGVFSFTPTEAQGPGIYTVTVNATDGTSTDSETITITVNEVNDAPVANDISVSTAEDTAKTITLNATDSDIPANTLTYSIVSGVGNGVLGTISGNQLTYMPDANYNGKDSFIYKANDGTVDSNPATVTITVSPVNDTPVANSDAASVDEDTSLTIAKSALLANDTDLDGDSLSLTSVSNPIHGSVVIDGNNIVFTPTANYNGSASFDYIISDGYLTDTATVNITVVPVNDAPVANDSTVLASQDTLVTINLSASDIDGDPLTYSIETGVSNGVLGDIFSNQVTYTPNSGYVGSDSFTFKANDGTVDSNIATINITVNPPPVISDEATNTPGETSITITWTTDHSSTSRVIYDTVSHAALDVAPNYGYANSTIEDSTKVTLHSVGLTGLTSGTTYYYRVISHGSPEVVGDEKTFTTENAKTNGGEVAGASTTSSASTECSDQKPGSAPTLVSIISNGPNEATLTWLKAKDPVTYYLLAYGTKPGVMLYGNPSVGGNDTTSYTVKGLSAGTRYYFRIRAGNNCMPGDFSNELSTKVNGQTLNEIPVGFTPGVLGTETTTTGKVLGKETASPTPEILPVSQGDRSRRNIIFAGIGIVLLAAGYYFFVRRKRV
jgi:VCBS repeat-containing protein